MGSAATLVSDGEHAAATALTLGTAGAYALSLRAPMLAMGAAGSAPVIGAGTQKLIGMLEEAGPSMQARGNAIMSWLPRGQTALLQTLEDGSQMYSGGAGQTARQIILNTDGSSVVKALDVAKGTYEVVKTITPQ